MSTTRSSTPVSILNFSHFTLPPAPVDRTTAHDTNTLSSWPTQDSSFLSQPVADPIFAAQTNEQPNGFDYGQYSQDATNQPDWSQDDGVAQADPSPAPADSNKPFVCPYSGCTNPYHPRQCDLAKHINNHTKPRKCDICGAGGAVAKDLNRHMWTHHPDEARRRGVPKEEDRCLVCGYTGRKDNVKRHRDTKNHWVSG
ncbi:hypothetical protein N657DRAFT_649046 [Parathielavia appendiculata]|uniref:C2H2-type domain-containing protein n=1 Tax=Parathielavia appendiculata TaxID=2587402 RepID=A0AAN6Z0N4_9PEZI|nr:hypothetical protein N657DRAFT_649046 [Parathielavia appendiculata]